jgi:uncharacterized DUF497 family protein
MLVVYLLGAMGEETEGSEFDWDGGNAEKNWLRHRVSQAECEQVFFNRPLVKEYEDARIKELEAYPEV